MKKEMIWNNGCVVFKKWKERHNDKDELDETKFEVRNENERERQREMSNKQQHIIP